MDAERWAKHSANPYHFTRINKLKNQIVVTMMGFVCTAGAPILVPATEQMQAYYNEPSREIILLTSCLFILGQGAGPFLFAPIAELKGRRTAFVVSMFGMFVFAVLSAVAPNLGSLIFFRFICGVFSSSGPTLGLATISDMYAAPERGGPMALYAIGPMMGPIGGSLLGSYLVLLPTWKWCLYFVAIVSFVDFALVFTLMDETFAPLLQQKLLEKDVSIEPISQSTEQEISRKTSQLSAVKPNASEVFRRTFARPPRLMANPLCLIFAIYFSYLYSLIYVFTVSVPILFGRDSTESELFSYRWPASLVGLGYLGLGGGFLIAALTNVFSQDKIYARLQKRNGGEQAPEFRLILGQIGAVVLPVGLALWAWLAQAEVSAAGPLVGEAVLGVGLMLAFNSVQSFLVDASQPFSAAAVAGATLLRSILGATLPLVAPIMFRKLDWGLGGTLLACASVPVIPAPLLMLRYGKQLRKRFPIRA